ncbi:unnamed protein product [Fraxinus pennsylvanica]|uniref:Auxin response factor n=1 Tax=Fraxinus pennsylvanica TaxID=56036 RepID=A0AAD2E893_9LAMI|nr:unnamed protein product [Fraxinus pennsylvanica]
MEGMVEKSLDSKLWHACAGGMVQMPLVNSNVFYFPQGHAEQTLTNAEFPAVPRIPPMILCRVAAVQYLADLETDEVYAKIRLIPVVNSDYSFDDDVVLGGNRSESNEKSTSFAKTLTQSDANNGGGFSVPRYCAETLFPRLDYSADPPVQTVIAKDVHGKTWNFRHIYRGTPRRHLLTTGWSTFVNQKKLVAGDSIVFLRGENGDLCVGIRRAKRDGDICGGHESSSGWSSGGGAVHRSGNNGSLRERSKVKLESVVEATFLAATGQPFEVAYYPRASTPEFCVKASSICAAMRIQWSSGMRFKMAFETEDSSRISWFMGTIACAQVADPVRWPNSMWRLLQVTWDESDMMQNVKRVSPWLVEMVSNIPAIHVSPFSPPRKKLRLPHYPDFSLDGQFSMPSFTGNSLGSSSRLCGISDNIATGIQGTRHTQIRLPLSDHLNNKLHLRLLPPSISQLKPHAKISDGTVRSDNDNEDISCLLSMGGSNQKSAKTNNVMTPQFVLFGQPILTEQQMSRDPGHCKVFLESKDVGQDLQLSVLESYEDLYKMLGNMFEIERLDRLSHVFYHDATGAIKQIGEEPFSEFTKTAKRLTILMIPGTRSVERILITGLPTAERGLGSSNQTGTLGIFA